MDYKAKIIAFYLPQFHLIPENNEWWGKGFTEWTNVGRAKPLFKGHYQPKVPADLGYYDLRMPEIRKEQAKMARKAGIYGFCYWHYWFGNGKQLLEMPFKEVLDSGKPDFPFCLGWANESWKAKTWNFNNTKKDKILIEQKYPGEKDNALHFKNFLPAFVDHRYIKIDNKPIFLIYKPEQFLKVSQFIHQWNKLAKENGLKDGFYFIAHTFSFDNYHDLLNKGFNAITVNPMSRLLNYLNEERFWLMKIWHKVYRRLFDRSVMRIIPYKEAIKYFVDGEEDAIENVIPTIMPNWDHSPRSARNGTILHGSTPLLFSKHVQEAINCVKNKKNKVIFLKSWNEWGEGNYMEPDLKFGHCYIEALKKQLF